MKTNKLLFFITILLCFYTTIPMQLTHAQKKIENENLIRIWPRLLTKISERSYCPCLKTEKPHTPDNIRSWLYDEHFKAILEKITELDLHSCELTSMPIPLDLFPNLKKLNLSNNQLLFIEIPNSLTNLECLWLDENKLLSINIPRTLINLKILVIGENPLASIEIPDTLVKLERLYLRNNELRLIEIPKTFTRLKWLYLGGNQLRSIKISPETRANLETICLKDHNNFRQERENTFKSKFENIYEQYYKPIQEDIFEHESESETDKNLDKNLIVIWRRLKKAITKILGMPPIIINKDGAVLDESGNTQEISNPKDILSWLHSEQNQVILNQITKLDFGSCELTSIPIELALFKNLKQLSLSNNKLKSIEISYTLTNLEYLFLSNNQLRSIDIPDTLTNLIWLNLSSNKLTSLQLPESLINLEDLTIHDNLLSSLKIPNSYTKLEYLWLAYNKLNSIRIPGTFTNLKHLFLNDNKLESIKIPESLASLKELRIQNNKFKYINIPDSIKGQAKIIGQTEIK